MAAKTMRDTISRKLINTTVLRDNILKGNDKIIEEHTQNIIKVISPHISDISALMATPGPEKRISFTKVNEMDFINASGIPIESVNSGINNCKLISKTFLTYSNPFYILLSSLISYHYRNKTMNGTIEVAKLYTLYLSLRIYKVAFGTFFPNYVPNPETMAYTIENLESNRFNVKKYKTIFKTIIYISDTHYDNFKDILANPIDDNILYYISNLYGRIKQMMRLISNKYYENHEKGLKQGTDTLYSKGDEDSDDYLNNVENISSLITVNSRKIYYSFISDSVPNALILKNVCEQTGMSFSKMMITMSKVIDSKEPMIEELLIKMLSYFFLNGGTTIKSSKFINDMVACYTVSNSADENIISMKAILEKIMNKYSVEFLKSSHIAHKSMMRKCLFLYLVLFSVNVS